MAFFLGHELSGRQVPMSSSRQTAGDTRPPRMQVSNTFVWSTLPDVEAVSGGKFDVPHFTGKGKIDRIVKEAGFPHHTFVIAPGYYQNFVGILAAHKQPDGSAGWALPLDPDVRCLHLGDIRELGNVVAGAFAHPDEAGNGAYLPLVGDFLSFNEIIATLNRQGHNFSYKAHPKGYFSRVSFPGAAEIAEMMAYWQAHTYLGFQTHPIELRSRTK